jgi:hypothetical protein
MNISFGKAIKQNSGASSTISKWVTDVLLRNGFDLKNIHVMVSEIECTQPDCVPIETLILFLGSQDSQQRHTSKILKQMSEVTVEDIENFVDLPYDWLEKEKIESNTNYQLALQNLCKYIESNQDKKERTYMIHNSIEKLKHLDSYIAENHTTMNSTDINNSQSTEPNDSDHKVVSMTAPTPTMVKMRPNITASNNFNLTSRVLPDVTSREATRPRHDKGIRQRGCPCCDPENIDNIIDKMLFIETPP